MGCGCSEDGPIDYYADNDTDGWGDCSNTFNACLNEHPGWAVTQGCDVDDAVQCESNIADCFGTLCGTAVVDECGECGGPGQIEYCLDSEGGGDGWGNPNISELACEGNQSEGFIANCGDVNSSVFCESNILDECDVCDGPGPEENFDCEGNCTVSVDECGTCGGSGIPDDECDCYGNVDIGCGCGEAGPSGCDEQCGSTIEFDECGICGGGGIPDGDCDCNGNVIGGCDNTCGSTLQNDECGVCGGGGIPDGECDCYGNVIGGCDNTCGSTLQNDECGVCGGDGIADGECDCDGNVDMGCGCGEDGPSGCDSVCGSTAVEDECGVCTGNNDCIPKLVNITPSNDSILDIHTTAVELEFSTPITLAAFPSPFSFDSDVYSSIDIDISYSNSTTILMEFEDPLASYDVITITLNSNGIFSNDEHAMKFDANDDNLSNDDNLTRDIQFNVSLLGDFDLDSDIDEDDINMFVSGWRDNDNTYDLGSDDNEGEAPHIIPAFDNNYNLDDLMSFIMMWNACSDSECSNSPSSLARIDNNGTIPEFYIDKNNLFVEFPSESDNEISTVRLVVYTKDELTKFNLSSSTAAAFDLVLDKYWETENAYEWNMARISTDDKINNLFVGKFLTNTTFLQEVIIGYEIINTHGEKYSSGMFTLNYLPVPEQFTVSSSYPNPFNPQTKIIYGLPETSSMDISVYDMRGRQVDNLFNGEQEQGYHSLIWNAVDVTSGVYFITFITDLGIKTQKVILVK
jgi:hypothetical protein